MHAVPPPMPSQVQNLVRPIVRSMESEAEKLLSPCLARPIPSYLWTIVLMAYFVWMSV